MATSTPEVATSGPVGDERAYLLFEQLRWAGRPTRCPHCAARDRCYLLRPAGGVRRTRTGAGTGRRLWKCGACRRQFSVLTGTVLQGTKVPLPAWIAAVELCTGTTADVTTAEVCRSTGLGPQAARHVLARWRACAAPEVSTSTDEPPALGAFEALDPRAAQALAALLAMATEEAAAIRERSPARQRHRAQYGPQLDLGGGAGERHRAVAAVRS